VCAPTTQRGKPSRPPTAATRHSRSLSTAATATDDAEADAEADADADADTDTDTVAPSATAHAAFSHECRVAGMPQQISAIVLFL
jgi:hypothetical protein